MSADLSRQVSQYNIRRQALAGTIAARGLAVGVITTAESVAYYSGNNIAGGNALLVFADGTTTAVCDAYDEYNFAVVKPALPRTCYPYTRQLPAVLAELLSATDGEIGVETSRLSATAWRILAEGLPTARLVSIDDAIATQRLVKDEGEIRLMRAAAAITTRAVQRARDELDGTPITEAALAAVLYTQMLEDGSDHLASQPYVKSGPRALHTHARWSPRQIDGRDHVLLELAASMERYHAPIMRTRLATRDDADYKATAEAVVAGRDAYLSALRPGVTVAALHARHETVLTDHGMLHRNRHAGGYSLGIAFAPTWGETDLLLIGPWDPRPLQAGMALHLISGLTDPADGIPHIGLSECVLVTATGYERLIDVPDFL
jgi:Xaa-Pro dipeptidase